MSHKDECRKVFSDKGLDTALVNKIATTFPNCVCEEHSVSSLSLGLVQDDEILVHLIMSPVDIDADAVALKPEANREATTRGMSCFRLQSIDHDECARLGLEREALKKDKGHKYQGFVAMKVKELRALGTNYERAYCVYDTALPNERRHADVMCALQEKAKIKEYQVKLWQKMCGSFSPKRES